MQHTTAPGALVIGATLAAQHALIRLWASRLDAAIRAHDDGRGHACRARLEGLVLEMLAAATTLKQAEASARVEEAELAEFYGRSFEEFLGASDD